MANTFKKKTKSVHNFRIEQELIFKLRSYADAENTTMVHIVSKALREFFAKIDLENQKN